MAYSLSNKCAKNLCKWTVLVQLIIKNVVTCFFGTQCSYCGFRFTTVVHKILLISVLLSPIVSGSVQPKPHGQTPPRS